MNKDNSHEDQAIKNRMSKIDKKILVLSGKGGVGKSMVAANLAASLAMQGKKVGLMDIDIHGPNIPQLFNLQDQHAKIGQEENTILPVKYNDNLMIMSIGVLLPNRDDAVIWRGPLKNKMITQFLSDVEWGELDYLIIDSPPGTGDEPLSIAQKLPEPEGAIIVTTPQQISIDDVRKCINFCHKLNVKVIGVIENMSGFICPDCGARVNIFGAGGGARMAAEMSVPFLGAIPLDKQVADAAEAGNPYLKSFMASAAAAAFNDIVNQITIPVVDASGLSEVIKEPPVSMKTDDLLRIAVPIAQGKLCEHFGHCETFAFVDIDESSHSIKNTVNIPPPGHQPGMLPGWLKEHGTNVVVAGGMGGRAKDIFTQLGINVIIGGPCETPEVIAKSYLDGTLTAGENICDH
ncbi:MAG: iron-sulfur cluster carrier protein MrpORP [Candidatus Hatepunaea meridiana]|nr:iron-sulfur cluster carrier protein MrpORP [Candidatus Hatepunaea meridiana]